MKPQTIAFVAGHSGGHIVPCLTLATHQLKQNDRSIFFSTSAPLDAHIIASSSIATKHVPLYITPPRRWYQVPMHLMRVIAAFFKSLFHLHRTKPSKIITTGGLVAVPVCLAAWILRIPIELYELNAVPGKAVKFLAPFASHIHVCFSQTKKYFPQSTCSLTYYPLRYSSTAHREQILNKANVAHELNIDITRKTLLILGGSQGSHFINRTIMQLLSNNPDLASKLNIVHQTGDSDQTDYATLYRELSIPAYVFRYHHNLQPFYGIADLVIARAGAGTIFETRFFKTACILIPLETKATDHQLDNARAIMAEYPEQFILVRQDEIQKNSDTLVAIIKKHI